jgi:hypothetical protein
VSLDMGHSSKLNHIGLSAGLEAFLEGVAEHRHLPPFEFSNENAHLSGECRCEPLHAL